MRTCRSRQTVTHVDLSRNSIHAIGAQALRQALHTNRTLTSLGDVDALPVAVGLRASLEWWDSGQRTNLRLPPRSALPPSLALLTLLGRLLAHLPVPRHLRNNRDRIETLARDAERASVQRDGMLKLLPKEERALRKQIFTLGACAAARSAPYLAYGWCVSRAFCTAWRMLCSPSRRTKSQSSTLPFAPESIRARPCLWSLAGSWPHLWYCGRAGIIARGTCAEPPPHTDARAAEDDKVKLERAAHAHATESRQVGALLNETIKRNAELVDAVATLQMQVDALRRDAAGKKVAAKRGAKAPAVARKAPLTSGRGGAVGGGRAAPGGTGADGAAGSRVGAPSASGGGGPRRRTTEAEELAALRVDERDDAAELAALEAASQSHRYDDAYAYGDGPWDGLADWLEASPSRCPSLGGVGGAAVASAYPPA